MSKYSRGQGGTTECGWFHVGNEASRVPKCHPAMAGEHDEELVAERMFRAIHRFICCCIF